MHGAPGGAGLEPEVEVVKREVGYLIRELA